MFGSQTCLQDLFVGEVSVSLDLDVVPTRPSPVSWSRLRERWRARLGEDALEVLGAAPSCFRLRTLREVDSDDLFGPGGVYVFRLHAENTLTLGVSSNEDDLDEYEYLSDYGRNISRALVSQLAAEWATAGYGFTLSSLAQRPRWEPRAMVTLACALADETGGVVLLMDDWAFNLGVGAYPPDEFVCAQWCAKPALVDGDWPAGAWTRPPQRR